MGNTRKFVWEWISEYPIVVFVMCLITLGHFIIEQINEYYNEELKDIISHSFFPNVIFIAFGCLIAVEAFHTWKKYKRYPRKAAVKPYFTKLDRFSSRFTKLAFFAMDWISISIFILNLYPIAFGLDTFEYKRSMFFHNYYALALVPFAASILFTIKKDRR